MTDLYSDLGLSPDATDEEIKAAAKEAAKRHHPDVGDGDEEAFNRSRNAYAVLRDPEARAKYDRGETDGTTREPSEEEQIGARMAMMMSQVLPQINDPATFDLEKGLKNYLDKIEQATLNQLKSTGQAIAKLKRIRKRLKFKGGEGKNNFIWHSLSAEIRAHQDSIKTIQQERKFLAKIRIRLDDYSYEFDAPKPPPNWGTTKPFVNMYSLADLMKSVPPIS